ncbi:MAG: Carbon monoxide-induced hydrogenase iron-sulfur protein CooX [Candidatus Bathyarchaeota archaeon B26-2]|nr:MAG: Carbon monoxide-induced hydrogenase iron-sulfur protein CooX [Candidatus Bathyarchaeota archaeon B26-2]
MAKVRIPQILREVASSLFKRPSTRGYPIVKSIPPEGFRGRQVFHPERCISCGLCARDCPSGAIEMVEVSGKRMPLFHLDRCIFCYLCVENCPRNAITSSTTYEMASLGREGMIMKPNGQPMNKEDNGEVHRS